MCYSPGCDASVDRVMIRTGVADTKPVLLGICPRCDTRRCTYNGCDQNVCDRTATRCPRGHPL
jgi:hypothetical protein